jgi:hypothetical protein
MNGEIWDKYGVKVVRYHDENICTTVYQININGCEVKLTGQEFWIFLQELLAKARRG